MLPLHSFTEFIRQQELFEAGERILLAVSGGKDSVLMTRFFRAAGFQFGIAHCNFGLRGTESVRDEEFVRALASELEVPFYVTHFKTKSFASSKRISTQMAARELRYAWFDQIRREENYAKIALAQHQDDAIETVLLNLVRGTGIAGLHGIQAKRGFLIRPLLYLNREMVDSLIRSNEIAFVEDSSNSSTVYARNKIRLEVIPRLKEINPGLEYTFMQNIERFAETEILVQQAISSAAAGLIREENGVLKLSIAAVGSLHPARLLLGGALKTYNFSETVVSDLLNSLSGQSGKSFYSDTHRITIDRDDLLLLPLDQNVIQPVSVHPDDSLISLPGQKIGIRQSEDIRFERNQQIAYIDAAKLIYPLVIRQWEEGDRFMPLGMRQFKKISDFFIDQKVPLPLKSQIPVLLNGNGEVIWIAGMRQDNRYKVTSSTKKVVIFEQKIK
ncbi:tRNA lysidine(34) synthetase TilS [Pedobacter antarcticus]|uniref:tRNA lysidine(34) synthetase TilS n=1 Tax=Pedobacter antarcticus TaxID=34086 RepID=UPI00087F8B39|nr:tRNA lysidine(34) synthetase TilS [Pedobacter antarcticus]SDM01564.1 tRNA(Ile)-lysidine synthase [Pedobacter antarcticus]